MIHSCTVWKHQLCGYRQSDLLSQTAFSQPCKASTGPVGLLGGTNQSWLCARLLPIVVLIYPVVCVHSCRLLGTQQHCLRPKGRQGPPLACPPTPTTLPPSYHPLISNICDITVVAKKLSQIPAVNTAQQS